MTTPADLTQLMRDTLALAGLPYEEVRADFGGNPGAPTVRWARNGARTWIILHFSPLLEHAPTPVMADMAKQVADALAGRPSEQTPLVKTWMDANRHRWTGGGE